MGRGRVKGVLGFERSFFEKKRTLKSPSRSDKTCMGKEQVASDHHIGCAVRAGLVECVLKVILKSNRGEGFCSSLWVVVDRFV